MKHLEWEYSDTITLYGSVIDGVVEDFEIMVYFDTDWESIKLLNSSMQSYMEAKFLKWALALEADSKYAKAYKDA